MVHDPSTVVRDGGDAWCFSTGHGVVVLRQDGKEWKFEGTVFPRGRTPAWHKEAVPENRGHLWAPDVIEIGGRWCVYYSVSSFGKNTSAIGMASRRKPGPGTEDDPWEDKGLIVSSGRGDKFNAIDPALVRDGRKLWMSFGSFWDGIMLIELDPKTGLRKDAGEKPIRLADAPEIEAPFIHMEGGWYYLFVNWGKCCRGADSTYEIRVGRSRKITGPYEDRAGNPMVGGGGTLVLGSEDRYIGPGHASIYQRGSRQWLVHHFYDGEDRGASKLRLVPLKWKDGWPVVGD
ncbi:MAG: arabinan endo-1,5-alpha-L-arabinosidase [Akkermansiaceae bacterium]|nr:arabinan endo-1,5-alpha-L-arabinosidase [Akkermansiaceae bacterium]MCP5544228.1 arabinan endo-1,5-alpha-L-arabinosidase [Akkermansiaceae bacterium]